MTPTLPLVSIVTPSLNQSKFLEETLRSVLEQDYPRIEYIVMDGGSSDETGKILERYADRLAYWESQLDHGQAHAINKGLRQASGELLGWLNADDLLLPGAVTRSVQAFENHPEVDVVYSRLERINSDGFLIPTPRLPKDRIVFSLEHVVGECVVNQPGSLWRREAMERSGLLDETLEYALDYEYWIRLALNGSKFLRLEEPAARFRVSAGSKTVAHSAAMAVEQEAVLSGVLEQRDLSQRMGLAEDVVHSKARRTLARIRLHAAYGYSKNGEWGKTLRSLGAAVRSDPTAVFDRRWLDLMIARLKRPRFS